jgi:hypothetical protein
MSNSLVVKVKKCVIYSLFAACNDTCKRILIQLFSGASMSHSTVSAQAEQSSNHSASTLGVSLTAAMLLAACGGGTEIAPESPPETPITEPAWGSMGILVAPGQASKVFDFPDGSCVASRDGIGGGPVFKVSLSVSSEGNLVVKAAATSTAAAEERFNLSLADSTDRSVRLNASEGALSRITYTMSNSEYSFAMSHNGTRGYLNASFPWVNLAPFGYIQQIRCENGPMSLVSLAPATAFLPSEQRFAKLMLEGATDAALDTPQNGYLANGVFYWNYQYEQDPILGYSVNLATGKVMQGERASVNDTFQGFKSSPEPQAVNFANLTDGSYQEFYVKRASEDIKQIKFNTGTFSGNLSRVNNALYGYGYRY